MHWIKDENVPHVSFGARKHHVHARLTSILKLLFLVPLCLLVRVMCSNFFYVDGYVSVRCQCRSASSNGRLIPWGSVCLAHILAFRCAKFTQHRSQGVAVMAADD